MRPPEAPPIEAILFNSSAVPFKIYCSGTQSAPCKGHLTTACQYFCVSITLISQAQHIPRKYNPFRTKSFCELKLPLLQGCFLNHSLGIASAWQYQRAGFSFPAFGVLKARVWSTRESQEKKKKNPEESSSHFKTAGLNSAWRCLPLSLAHRKPGQKLFVWVLLFR